MKPLAVMLGVLLGAATAQGQVSVAKEKPGLKSEPVPRSETEKPAPIVLDGDGEEELGPESRPRNTPRNTEESSSRDTIIDLRPPRNDHKRRARDDHDAEATGVSELKPWNPHKSAKAVEVGEYYFKQKNYKAAISRFREALEYKPRDAHATYRLGEVLERTGGNQEALQRYEEYLKILKNGPFAEECKQGIERLKAKTTAKLP